MQAVTLRRVIHASDQRPGNQNYKLGPAKLYLDDIDAIFQVLLTAAQEAETEAAEEPGNRPAVAITAGEAIADAPDDLREARPAELRKVRLSLERPAVTVELSYPRSAQVSVLAADAKGRAIAEGIRDYVNARSHFYYGFRPNSLSDGVLIGTFTLAIVAYGWNYYWSLTQNVLDALFIVVLTCGLNLISARRLGQVRIIPRRERESRGFSAETRKQWAIALAGAIVGAAVLGLAGLWAGLFSGHH